MTNTSALAEADDKTAMNALKAEIEAEIAKKVTKPEIDPENPADLGTPTGITGDLWDGTSVATAFQSGTGVYNDPYVIHTAAQLAYFAKYVNTIVNRDTIDVTKNYFVLDQNIDLGGKAWTTIGTKEKPFMGTFNGKGFTVYNFTVSNTDPETAVGGGLFGAISNATVKNLNVDWARIIVIGKNSLAGGITGLASNSNILACKVGENVAIKLTDADHGGSIYAGGIVGSAAATVIKNCINSASVYAGNNQGTVGVGGIIGLAGANTEVSFCVNNGNIKAGTLTTINNIAGGIIGNMGASNIPASVTDCTNHGNVESRHTAGGIVGRLNVKGNIVVNCYTTGKVTGNLDYAGLGIGRAETNAAPTNCGYYEQVPPTMPDKTNVWEVATVKGKTNTGLIDVVSDGTFNAMTKEVMGPLMETQLSTIEAAIVTSIAAAEVDPTPVIPDDPTENDPTEEDPKQEDPKQDEPKQEEPTDNKPVDKEEDKKGCASSTMSIGVLMSAIILAGAAFSIRKKEEI